MFSVKYYIETLREASLPQKYEKLLNAPNSKRSEINPQIYYFIVMDRTLQVAKTNPSKSIENNRNKKATVFDGLSEADDLENKSDQKEKFRVSHHKMSLCGELENELSLDFVKNPLFAKRGNIKRVISPVTSPIDRKVKTENQEYHDANKSMKNFSERDKLITISQMQDSNQKQISQFEEGKSFFPKIKEKKTNDGSEKKKRFQSLKLSSKRKQYLSKAYSNDPRIQEILKKINEEEKIERSRSRGQIKKDKKDAQQAKAKGVIAIVTPPKQKQLMKNKKKIVKLFLNRSVSPVLDPIKFDNFCLVERILKMKPSENLARQNLDESFSRHEYILEMRAQGNVKQSYKVYGRSKTRSIKRPRNET